jgi:hypothetical protein
MRKKTSTIIGLVTAIILTAYMVPAQLSYAYTPGCLDCCSTACFSTTQPHPSFPQVGKVLGGARSELQILGGHHAQLRGERSSHPGLGASQCPNLSPASQANGAPDIGRCVAY